MNKYSIMNKIKVILKNNTMVYNIYCGVFNTIFKILKIWIKPQDNIILMNSFGGKKYDDSPRVIFEYMKTQEKYKKYFEITKHVSYDLWEMNEGVHLYSLSSIISGLGCMKKIYETIDNKQENLRLKQEKRNKIALKLNKYIQLLKDYIEDNLIDKNTKTLKRNLKDNNMDISVIGAVYPFNVFNPNEKVIKNTVDKINMTLRTHTSGYLRFEYDNYMGGNNPWIITTLWMALYYIKINDLDNAKKCFSFVVNTSLRHGFLAEQVNNDDKNFKWVIGLGWSHAMFIIVLNELLKANEEKNN